MKSAPVSKALSKASWDIVKGNKSLFAFPLIGALLSIIPFVIFWVPAGFFYVADKNVIAIVLTVLGIWGVSLAIQFSLGALVVGADEALHGRPVSVGACFGRAFGRVGPLFAWSGINAIMQVFTSALEGDGDTSSWASLIMSIFRSILGAIVELAWRLITLLVVPLIMLEGTGAVGAMKGSFNIFRKHWGTQVKGFVRISVPVALLFMLPGILLVIGGVLLAIFDKPIIGIPLMLLGVILVTVGSLVLNTVRGVFAVALYRFLHNGETLPGYTQEELQAAVVTS